MSSTKDANLLFLLFLLCLLILYDPAIAPALDEIPSSTADFSIQGAPGDGIGPVLAVGDFNCDREPDLFIGAPGFSFASGQEKSGSTLLYGIFGPIDPEEDFLDLAETRADLEIISSISAGTLGLDVVLADLNDDGCDDIIVGDPQARPGNYPFAGQVSVLFGRADAPAGWIVDWDNNLPDLAFIYDWLFLNLGESIGTGDFDGDGSVDIFISGVPLPKAGAVYVVFGPFERSSGATRDFASEPADLQIVGSTMPGPWYNSDYLIADLNGDSRSDLFLGAANTRNPFSHGDAYIFFGRPLSTLEDVWNMAETPADVTIRTSDASSYRAFGHRLALADMNGGGKNDLLIADPWYTVDFGPKGALLLFEHHRLSSGTKIDLSNQIPDQTVVGRGVSWRFFDSLAVAKGAAGDALFAASPYFTHDQLPLCGAVFRLDPELFIESGDYIRLDYADPSAIYYGSSKYAMFGQSVFVAELNGNESLDLVIGGKGDSSNGGIIYLFFDQVDTTLPEDDDDHEDDDSSAASIIDHDIDDAQNILSLPDEEGGCRCDY